MVKSYVGKSIGVSTRNAISVPMELMMNSTFISRVTVKRTILKVNTITSQNFSLIL